MTNLLKRITYVSSIILIAFSIFSCRKIRSNPADYVQGTYQGKGRDNNEIELNSVTITVTKLGNKKIEISGTYFETFTKEIRYIASGVIVEKKNAIGLQFDEHENMIQFSFGDSLAFHGYKK